jgi:ParB family chromosome partitioning protein
VTGVQTCALPISAALKIPVTAIVKSPWQPRRHFTEETLSELSQSIKEHGVLQPILVRAIAGGYELIAGERRFRASILAGLTEVPAIIKEADDGEAMKIALVENLQREDLNIIEESEGYRTLSDKFGLTQEQIAESVGKSRASVANALRLLTLPIDVKQMVTHNQLSAGHAKLLGGVELEAEQKQLAQRTIKENLSVRQLEKIIQKLRSAPRKPRATRADIPENHLNYLRDRLHTHFGTSVRLNPCRTYANGKKSKGSVEIDFYSNDELDRILQILGLAEESL